MTEADLLQFLDEAITFYPRRKLYICTACGVMIHEPSHDCDPTPEQRERAAIVIELLTNC